MKLKLKNIIKRYINNSLINKIISLIGLFILIEFIYSLISIIINEYIHLNAVVFTILLSFYIHIYFNFKK